MSFRLTRRGRFSERYLLEIRIDGLTQAKIALLHHVDGGNLGDDATLDATAICRMQK